MFHQHSTLAMTDSTAAPTTAPHTTEPPSNEKRQPWRAVWPAPRESQPQAQIYGFKKGETMVFDGNAGNFFARDGWKVEQESASRK
jgi:hypothetical protein